MTKELTLREALEMTGWFYTPGAYVLVDGQYGSTGKGLVAAAFAEAAGERIDWVTTNSGPNSGHTGYIGRKRILTQQVPVAWAACQMLGHQARCFLNAGALINLDILRGEMKYRLKSDPVYIHPHAVCIIPEDVEAPAPSASAIASTGKGTGEAMARKINRDKTAVVSFHMSSGADVNFNYPDLSDMPLARVFVETAQGFSLGINSGFYPYTTSRECTVMQALSDAHLPAFFLKKVVMVVRSLPIRVGNTDMGKSGGIYPDQREHTWEEPGLEPELTTVTKRVRRVFSWSWQQFNAAVKVNRPEVIVFNFAQYLNPTALSSHLDQLVDQYINIMGVPPELLIIGYGPYNEDLVVDTERSRLCPF